MGVADELPTLVSHGLDELEKPHGGVCAAQRWRVAPEKPAHARHVTPDGAAAA
jgi:hypothetical protein